MTNKPATTEQIQESMVDVRALPEYQEGIKAFRGGVEQCPYIVTSIWVNGVELRDNEFARKRIAWWSGYLDARTHKRLHHIFTERGWPFGLFEN